MKTTKTKNRTAKFTEDDLQAIQELANYLGGLRSIAGSDVTADECTFDRQHLEALIKPAFDKAETLWCDLAQRMSEEAEGAQ